MKKIDLHTHIVPKNVPSFKNKFGYGGFTQLEHCPDCSANMVRDDGTFFRKIQPNCFDENVRLKDLDKFEVNVQVLSTIPIMFSYFAKPKHGLEVSQFLNDHIANVCVKFPKRFVGLGTLPMQDSQLSIQELERCKNELGLVGVEIGSNVNDENLNEEKFFPIFKRAQELNMSIFVHPWNMMGKEKMNKYWLPWLVGMPAETTRAITSMIFGGVFERLPQLKVAFAHGGGSFPFTFPRIEHGLKVRPDLCAIDNPHSPRKYLKNIYVDSLTHDLDPLNYIIKIFGADRVALGTDYPFPLGELEPGKLIEESTLSQNVKEQLLYKTALEFLNLEMNKFL